MYLYVELWKPRPAWTELAREQRQEYLHQMTAGIGKMVESGIKLVGLTCNEENVPHNAQYRYAAVWMMPTKGHVHMLENAVLREGWENYFEIGNARGQLISVEEAVEDMVRW